MDDGIYKQNNWEFNDEVSMVFDKHVKQSIPLYEEFQSMVVNLSEFFIKNNEVVYDLGCSTGETAHLINSKYENQSNKNVRFVLIDNSNSMLDKARLKCSEYNNIDYVLSSIEDIEYKNTNLIISLWTLHFLTYEKRFKVVESIYKGLNKGGAFIFVDKCFASNVTNNDIFTQIYHDFKEEQGFTTFDIREKDKSLRSVLNLMPLDENIEMLKSAGFKKIDIFMKCLNFVGFIAVK